MHSISASEEIQSVTPGDHCVIRSRRRDGPMGWTSIDGVLDQNLPLVRRLLKGVQVECDQVVKEVALDLATEYVDFAAQNVQCMSISPWRSRPSGQSS